MYFKQLAERCNELNAIAQKYLDGLPFIDNDTLAQSIWKHYYDIAPKDTSGEILWRESKNESENEALHILDSCVPYYNAPRNGSLHYAIGYAITAQEANLRALYEHLINGAEKRVFKMLADL